MSDNEPSDFEIGNVENFSGVKDQEFSHSSLVMSAMKKVVEAANHELRPGWFNTKTDRNGNTIRSYIEDTRKVFLESIKTCCMILAPDFDKEAEDYIDDCLKSIQDRKKELIKVDDDSWESLTPDARVKNARIIGMHIKGYLTHPQLQEELVNYELEMYRSIFAELGRLTKRLDYYKSESFEV